MLNKLVISLEVDVRPIRIKARMFAGRVEGLRTAPEVHGYCFPFPPPPRTVRQAATAQRRDDRSPPPPGSYVPPRLIRRRLVNEVSATPASLLDAHPAYALRISFTERSPTFCESTTKRRSGG